jgi:hypothetical protein
MFWFALVYGSFNPQFLQTGIQVWRNLYSQFVEWKTFGIKLMFNIIAYIICIMYIMFVKYCFDLYLVHHEYSLSCTIGIFNSCWLDENMLVLSVIFTCFFWSHQAILSVSTNWLWYWKWKLSVSVMSMHDDFICEKKQ